MKPVYDPYREAKMAGRLAGYQMAARQYREGKQIAKPLGTLERVLFMIVVFGAVAAVSITAAALFA